MSATAAPDDAPVRLRAHHLLCILTYKGLGYSPAFVDGMSRTVDRIGGGAAIVVVDGADDICAPLCRDEGAAHCHEATVSARDAAAFADVAALLGLEAAAGIRLHLTAERIARLRAAFAAGTVRRACGRCQWAEVCDDIAAAGFKGTRLGGGAG